MRIFDLREGEINRAVIMQVNIFLIISTLLIVKPTVNGLFLAKFGVEQLPYAFILVAIVAAAVSSIYSKLLFRVNVYHIYQYTLASSVVILVIFGVLLRLNIAETVVLYVFYVWVAIFALLTTSQFWILANMLFDSRQAKRIFSFIGAGAISGGIFGGYLTSLLSQTMSSEYLTVVSAFLLAPTLFISRPIWNQYLKKDDRLLVAVTQVRYDSRHPFRLIRESRHLTYIAAIVGISVMVAKLVDYQFGGIASDIIKDPDELTAFFGFWFSTFNVISLFIQLFVTRRLVGQFGVVSTIFILPAAILIGAIVLFMFPTLLLGVVFLKMSDGGLKQSINKAAMELLIFPISAELKNRTKTFIDVFIDSLATGIIGVLLIFIVKGMGMSYRAVSVLLIILIGVWIFLASRVRKEYVFTISNKLRNLSTKQKPKPFDLSKSTVIDGIHRVLREGSEDQKIFMLVKIRSLRDHRFIKSIIPLLEDPSPQVRTEALMTANAFRHPQIQEQAFLLTKDENPAVRIRAIEYLISHYGENQNAITSFLNDPDINIWSATMLSLAMQVKNNPHLPHRQELIRRINNCLKKLKSKASDNHEEFQITTLIKAIGYGQLTEFYSLIDLHLDNTDIVVQRAAIAASGHTQNAFLFESLMRLAEGGPSNITVDLTDALAHYSSFFLVLLKDYLQSKHAHVQIDYIIPSVLRKIPKQSSVDYLFELLSHVDARIRREALKALNYLKNNNEHLWFDNSLIVKQLNGMIRGYMDMLTVLYAQSKPADSDQDGATHAREALVALLEKRLDLGLEFIFRGLGLRYPPEDIMSAYNGLKAPQSELRVSAIEMLDNILDKDIRKVLIPLIETSMMDQINTDTLKRLKLSIPDEKTSFEYLLTYGDERLALAAIYLLKKGQYAFKDQLRNAVSGHFSPKVRQHASEF